MAPPRCARVPGTSRAAPPLAARPGRERSVGRAKGAAQGGRAVGEVARAGALRGGPCPRDGCQGSLPTPGSRRPSTRRVQGAAVGKRIQGVAAVMPCVIKTRRRGHLCSPWSCRPTRGQCRDPRNPDCRNGIRNTQQKKQQQDLQRRMGGGRNGKRLVYADDSLMTIRVHIQDDVGPLALAQETDGMDRLTLASRLSSLDTVHTKHLRRCCAGRIEGCRMKAPTSGLGCAGSALSRDSGNTGQVKIIRSWPRRNRAA